MRESSLRLRSYPALFFVLFAAACSSGGGSGGQNPPVATPGSPSPPVGLTLPGPRPAFGPRSFVTFESGQVRPLALSADGARLYAANTPDGKLEIFSVSGAGLIHINTVPVGMEPVAVAEANNGDVWVVNHLSDNVSIVDMAQVPPRVRRTLWVGDEPRDIVFAGSNRNRAFVATAHRGQRSPVNPALTSQGAGRADVWVFDADNPGVGAGGTPLTIMTLFGDKPRALAVTPDGSRVYAAIFNSGNRTTILPPGNFTKAPPLGSADSVSQPNTGLIVKFNGNNWVDELAQTYNSRVPFTLPDRDVFEIDATVDPPSLVRDFRLVGTTLFNMAVNPINGDVYVSNTDARNEVRFSGEATRASTTVRGHVADHRITIINGGVVRPRILNKHIDFSRRFGTVDERETSLSLPLGMAVSADGSTLFVTAFGSGKVGVYATGELVNDTFVPNRNNWIELSAGGPTGIVLDEINQRAYVLTRFDNGISTVDTVNRIEVSHLTLFNPEPQSVVDGRPFLYDARLTSDNGNDSCATCHVFGDNDALAWDLGDPDGSVKPIPNVFITISPAVSPFEFHPMKGPMTTQSMRGIKGHGPMHWRGDRTGAARGTGETLEEAAFKEFNEAIQAFSGRQTQLTDAQMQLFTDFAMELSYPPNPIRALDNSLTPDEAEGQRLYNTGIVRQSTGNLEVCQQCHVLNPSRGLFGTAGLMADNSQPGEPNFKIPHFRDQYQKVGMFGFGFNTPAATGQQIRGFGYNHNGATTSNFILADLDMPPAQLRQIRAFLFAFPTEMAPIVGQQVTLSANNGVEAAAEIDLLISEGMATTPVPRCDLIVKSVIGGEQRGWLMQADGTFVSDRAGEVPVSRTDLEAFAQVPAQALTFTCGPWGSGVRMGIDRDLDGILDGDE